MESKAYSDSRIEDWMSRSYSFPPPTSFLDRSGEITAGETLEGVYNGDFFRFGEIRHFLGFPLRWEERASPYEQIGQAEIPVMSAMLCDAWVYLCWLEAEGKQSEAVAYRKLISAIVQIPDLWNQSHIFWLYHYHQVESNFYEVMPTMWDFTFEGERRKKIWRWKKQFDANGEKGEDYKRADDSWHFLSGVFHENGKEKKAHLKKGLEFINYAAIHGDSLFFETLGKALSTSRDDGEKLPFDDFRESVLKLRGKVPSSRAYARRLWISRGLFLLPKAQLADSPFSMSDGAINALTQPRYKKDGSGENKNAEGLLRSPEPWFEVSRQSEEDATKTVLPLTEEGKKHLPEYAEEGFPWSVMSSDLI